MYQEKPHPLCDRKECRIEREERKKLELELYTIMRKEQITIRPAYCELVLRFERAGLSRMN